MSHIFNGGNAVYKISIMSIIIQRAIILDPDSPHHNKIRDVHINKGIIHEISAKRIEGKNTISAKGMYLIPGMFDMRAHFNDPGFEQKEDIESGCDVAKLGGFTGVALLPNTDPVTQSKGQIEYLKRKSEPHLTDAFPMAAITMDTQGESITEMIDLHEAGAIAFTDGENTSWHTDVLLKALIYVQKFKGLIINRPEDKMLTRFGDMHEGVTSTMLGLKGMPSLAEELAIKRDLDILEYTGGKIHFSCISTSGSVNLIKEAKKKGLQVTCDVNVHHLIFDDTMLTDFDTNYKSNPPFRNKKDQKALINGIKDGIIDAIVSGHQPQDAENKNLEFDQAAFGLIGLQTFIPAFFMIQEQLEMVDVIKLISHNPRKILGLEPVSIVENATANMTLIDPKEEWIFDDKTNKSKSRNSPLFEKSLKGKVKAVFNGKKQYMDQFILAK